MAERPVKILDLKHVGQLDSDGVIGDVNQDGTVNVLDVVIMVNYILSGQEPFNEQIATYGDMNNDGTINVLDVVATVNFITNGG
tara:strand:+ start:209 stop:460 length:252 start_codon:yes stop_codon:yes gene_type:complete